jgi:hypothetical protein
VTTCDLAAPIFACRATVLMADPLAVVYASRDAAYAWTTAWSNEPGGERSVLYRLPCDGSDVSAVRVSGTPPDQLAFLETADRHLNVLTQHANGVVALLRLPAERFTDGSQAAPASAYRGLVQTDGFITSQRFVGSFVLFGTVDGNGSSGSRLFAARWAGPGVFRLETGHLVERIEALGDDAVAVGSRDHDLHVTSVALDGEARIAGRYVRAGASQTEMRSHGFLYRPDGPRQGIWGLPIARTVPRGLGGLHEESASVMFVRNDDLRFRVTGELDASAGATDGDGCRASCVDWYGTRGRCSSGRGSLPCSATSWWRGESRPTAWRKSGAPASSRDSRAFASVRREPASESLQHPACGRQGAVLTEELTNATSNRRCRSPLVQQCPSPHSKLSST